MNLFGVKTICVPLQSPIQKLNEDELWDKMTDYAGDITSQVRINLRKQTLSCSDIINETPDSLSNIGVHIYGDMESYFLIKENWSKSH